MDNILKRKDGETDYEYCFRLSWEKSKNQLDIDWQEIVDLCGLDWSADHCRKTMIGAIRHQEYINTKTREQLTNEQYTKLLEKELELEKKKVKIQDMKTALNKQIRETARKESLGELLEDKLKELNMQPKIINDEYKSRISSGKSAIALFSDWHYGIEVDNFLNKFNPDICRERVEKLTDKIIDYCQLNKIDKLHVFIMGDIISSENYNVIRLQNRENLIDQIINASDLLTKAIIKLSKYIPYCLIGVCTGNHCRSQQKGDATNKDNYIHLIKKYLELGLTNVSNVAFIENSYDDEIINAEINGLSVIATHGDKVAKTNGSYKLSAIIDKKIDLLCLGHWHESRMETNHRTIVHINGSLVSSDEYARNLNLYAFPTQKLLIIGDKEIECCYDIRLDK